MGNGCFFCHASWGERIDVVKLILGCGEVFHLQQAFFHQRLQAVIKPAHVGTQILGLFVLGEDWVFLQDAHQPEISVFLNFGLATCHKIDEFPLYAVGLNKFEERYRHAVSRSASAIAERNKGKFCINMVIVAGAQPFGPHRHQK